MNQIHWGLKDDVKDQLLSLPDPWTLNETINEAIKCDNHLIQHRQDKHSRQQIVRHSPSMTAGYLNSHSEMEDMQIDAVRVKTLTPEEQKQHIEEGLCLYCGEEGHKVGNYSRKQHQRVIKTRGAFVQENKDAQSQ